MPSKLGMPRNDVFFKPLGVSPLVTLHPSAYSIVQMDAAE